MKSVKCYGRKHTTQIEKSFVREFFDGNQSTNYAWNDSSGSDLFTSEDLYTANKENIKKCVLLSPVLFDISKTEGSIKESITPEQKVLNKKNVKNVKVKPKKKLGKKQICGPKTKQVKSIVSKFDKCSQPCWLEIQNHKFTVEKLCSKRIIRRDLNHNNASMRNSRIRSTVLFELSPAITSSNIILSKSPTNYSISSQVNKNNSIVTKEGKEKRTKSVKNSFTTEYSDGLHTDVNSLNAHNIYSDAADSSGDLFSNNLNYYRSTQCNSISSQFTNNKPNKNFIPIHKISKAKQGKFCNETAKVFNISKELHGNTPFKQKENLEYLTLVFKNKQNNNNVSPGSFLNKINSLTSPTSSIVVVSNNGSVVRSKNSLNENSCTKIETAIQDIQKHKLSTVGASIIEINDSFKQQPQNILSSKASYSSSYSLNTSLDLFDECDNFHQYNNSFETSKLITSVTSSKKVNESSNIKTSNSNFNCKQNGASFEVSKLVPSISSPKKVTYFSSIETSDNPFDKHSTNSSEAIKFITPANSSKKTKDPLCVKESNSDFDHRQNEIKKKGRSSKSIAPTSSSNKTVDFSHNKVSYNSLNYHLVESLTKKKPAMSSSSLLQNSQKLSFCEGKSANKFLTSTPMVCNNKKSIFNLLNDSFAPTHVNKMKTFEDLTPSELIENFDNDEKYVRSCLSAASKRNLKNSSVSYKNKMPRNTHSLQSLNVSKQPSSSNSVSSRSCMLNKSSVAASPRNDDELTRKKLLQLCNQDSVTSFLDAYDWSNSKIRKIGEGTYGEVFTISKGKLSSVLKVIPVSHSGDIGSYQELKNVHSEVTIAKCLSELRNNKRNQTKNFNRLNKASIVSGLYPLQLISAWDLFSKAKSTYNSRPDIFEDNQLFVILELEYGGKDLSCFVLRNAVEAESIIKQVAMSFAIAEEQFLFEHRDLHLGNILVQRNRSKTISYKLRGKDISFASNGILVTIIDFTLSRLYEDGYIYYNDLAEDVSLFNQSGDYQFEIYRAMKEKLSNEWHECSLYSNVLWLKYLCVKLEECEYSRPSTAAHRKGLEAIANFKNYLSPCNSALDCLTRFGIAKEQFERNTLQDSKLTKKSILISRNSFQKSKQSICI